MSQPLHLSVVSPVYQSEPLVDQLVTRLRAAAQAITSEFEIILVEDRSSDGSWERIRANCERHPEVVGVKLSRNFGQQHAIQAGLDISRGEWVVILDCDLQDPPEDIDKLYRKAQEGYDIVHGRRDTRRDGFLKKAGSVLFNRALGYLTDTEQDPAVANFVILHRKVVDALGSVRDQTRYYPMLVQWVGFTRTKVNFSHADRPSGRSSFSFRRRLSTAAHTVLTFSDKPLRLTVAMGGAFTLLSLLCGFALVAAYLAGSRTVPGWTSLALLVCFFSGLIISVLGVVGLYVGKIFDTVKIRPTYIVEKKVN